MKKFLFLLLIVINLQSSLISNQTYNWSEYFNIKNLIGLISTYGIYGLFFKKFDIFTLDRIKAAYINNPEKEEKLTKIQNSLFWAAFGDAFGNEVEFIKKYEELRQKQGYILNVVNNNYADLIQAALQYSKKKSGHDFIVYTDDTRMSLLVIKALLDTKSKKNLIIKIARNFKKDMRNKNGWRAQYRAPGNSTIDAIEKLPKVEQISDQNVLLSNENFDDAKGGGCGSVMHAYPFGYVFNSEKAKELAAKHSRITHNHPIAIASCGGLAWMVSKLIHDENVTKEGLLKSIADVCDTLEDEYMEKDYSSIKEYTFRMDRIITAALDAAEDMKKIRKEIAKSRSYSDPYLIPFQKVMQDVHFIGNHENFFPYTFSEDYNYDSKQFPGWDAATCFAAAIYNFSLWIPEDYKKLTEENAKICMTNALRSALYTAGDTDSIAAITGALCGAAFSVDCIPDELKVVIEESKLEDSKLIEYYAEGLSKK